jgi:hypothetical protein
MSGTILEDQMPAAEVHEESEIERIEHWRAEELERAGFSPAHASKLAARHDVDLHRAVELVQRGCPADLAFKILV